MRAQDIENRGPDAQRWIQGATRILRDVGHDLAAQPANLAWVTPEDPLAADVDAAMADDDPGLRVPEEGEGNRALAAPRLANHPQDLASWDLEADVVNDRLARGQRKAERLDRDGGRCRGRGGHRRGVHAVTTPRVVLGVYERPRLRAIASPVRFTPIVRIAIMAAGATTDSQFSEMYWRFSLIITAQLELGGWRPSPRKLTEATIRIENVKRSPTSTRTGARMFGTTSRRSTAGGRSPRATAAST